MEMEDVERLKIRIAQLEAGESEALNKILDEVNFLKNPSLFPHLKELHKRWHKLKDQGYYQASILQAIKSVSGPEYVDYFVELSKEKSDLTKEELAVISSNSSVYPLVAQEVLKRVIQLSESQIKKIKENPNAHHYSDSAFTSLISSLDNKRLKKITKQLKNLILIDGFSDYEKWLATEKLFILNVNDAREFAFKTLKDNKVNHIARKHLVDFLKRTRAVNPPLNEEGLFILLNQKEIEYFHLVIQDVSSYVSGSKNTIIFDKDIFQTYLDILNERVYINDLVKQKSSSLLFGNEELNHAKLLIAVSDEENLISFFSILRNVLNNISEEIIPLPEIKKNWPRDYPVVLRKLQTVFNIPNTPNSFNEYLLLCRFINLSFHLNNLPNKLQHKKLAVQLGIKDFLKVHLYQKVQITIMNKYREGLISLRRWCESVYYQTQTESIK